MALGAQTVVVDGSRFAVPTGAAYNPYGFGQLVQPQPIQNVNFPPMLPGGGTAASSGGPLGESIGGYGAAGQNSAAAGIANQNPWSFRNSPLIFALLALITGLLMLGVVHWRKTMLAGAGANAHLGPAEAGGEAGV